MHPPCADAKSTQTGKPERPSNRHHRDLPNQRITDFWPRLYGAQGHFRPSRTSRLSALHRTGTRQAQEAILTSSLAGRHVARPDEVSPVRSAASGAQPVATMRAWRCRRPQGASEGQCTGNWLAGAAGRKPVIPERAEPKAQRRGAARRAKRRRSGAVFPPQADTLFARTMYRKPTGRGSRARTRDLRFWRPPLYQLSYTPSVARASCIS